jgi:glycosyltransferase involved in cell wall biosynthesis
VYEGRVLFFDKMPFDELFQYTVNADIGLSLDKPIHLNYRFSLPNKLFDYIHAGVPVLVSDLPELKRIVNQFHVGLVVNQTTPSEIAHGIQKLLTDPQYDQIKENCFLAAKQLNWQEEKKVLMELYSEVAREING